MPCYNLVSSKREDNPIVTGISYSSIYQGDYNTWAFDKIYFMAAKNTKGLH